MDVAKINKKAWNHEVKKGNYWTIPVDSVTIAKARKGILTIHLTPEKLLTSDWYDKIEGNVLALASGGGQQVPQFAAKGCTVTSLDNSDEQLAQDRAVAKKENLTIKTIQKDMRDLSAFEDNSFDVVFNAVSVNFIPDVMTMYKEVFRVLKKGGYFFTAFANPILYCFDEKAEVKKQKLKIKYTLPYSDLTSISKKKLKKRIETNDTLEFSHTLQALIGDLLDMGFSMCKFETDHSLSEPLDSFVQDAFIAIMCQKN